MMLSLCNEDNDLTPDSRGLTMRSSGSTSVGIISKLMDVEASLGIGIVAADMISDLCGSRFGDLLEGDDPADFGITTKDGDLFATK